MKFINRNLQLNDLVFKNQFVISYHLSNCALQKNSLNSTQSILLPSKRQADRCLHVDYN